jgi:hypothetical protein
MTIDAAAATPPGAAVAGRNRRLLTTMNFPAIRRVGDAIAIGVLIAFAMYLTPKVLGTPGVSDAEAYWRSNLDDLYALKAGSGGAFLYSPLVAQFLVPFTSLPLPAFYSLMLAANLAALAYLLTPMGAVAALFVPFVAEELAQGNIHLLMAAALVAGVRYPGWFAFFPLTKVTPAVVFLWHRGRDLAIAVAVTVALIAASAAIAPDLWLAWIERLSITQAAPPERAFWTAYPIWLRLGAATGIVLLARWRQRPAALPFALALALPIPWFGTLSVLAATPRLLVPLNRRLDNAR